MNLSKTTLEILKNFATINQGIIFKPGNELRTMNVMKSVFASAIIPDVIPREFAIYDLNEFLASYSLIDSADIAFEEDFLLLSEGITELEYYYSNPEVVVSPGDKKIIMPKVNIKFILEKLIFDQILKSSGVMKLKDLTVTSSGIKIWNRTNVGNKLKFKIPNMVFDGEESLLKVENLKLIPVDYDVEISNTGISHFISKNEEFKIEYFVALESMDE